jgi:hypothetical protein
VGSHDAYMRKENIKFRGKERVIIRVIIVAVYSSSSPDQTRGVVAEVEAEEVESRTDFCPQE